MKYLSLFFVILFSQCINAQTSSTFFVKNKFENSVRKVYGIGDKITLEVSNSTNNYDARVKGVIKEITIDKIKVDNTWIELSRINTIIAQSYIGLAGMALGGGIWIKGLSMPDSNGGYGYIDLSGLYRLAIITVGAVVTTASTVSLALIHKKYRREKFIFNTFVSPVL
jgi:hypothetical protein